MRSSLLLALLLSAGAGAAAAQQGELQLGPVAAYGSPTAFRAGGGLVAGISLGRLVYFGLRWVHFEGGSQTLMDARLVADEVTTRADLYASDVGLVLPAGRFEIVPGLSAGVIRFRQLSSRHGVSLEFVAAPELAVHVYLAGIVVIPELQYFMAGSPDALDWTTGHAGWLPSVRVVIPIEIRRIRY